MRVIFGTGGTGGHLYPALALADYMKEHGVADEFLFVGTRDRLEARVVPNNGYPYQGLEVTGFAGSPMQKAESLWRFMRAIGKAKKTIQDFQPDLVIGFGGYPSAAIVYAAQQLHVKTMIHEQNSVVGKANRFLLKNVDAVVACYQKAVDVLPEKKTYLYGNPRATVVKNMKLDHALDQYGLDEDKKTVLIVMGSLGSASVNRVVEDMIQAVASKSYQLLFVTGEKQYDVESQHLPHLPDNVKMIPYVKNMPPLLNAIDLVVTRAGASTLAEITALGVASIIIPSPYVANNHQEYNARALYDEQAAEMILEKDLTAATLIDKIDALIFDEEKLAGIRQNALRLGHPDACAKMCELALSLVKGT